MLSRVLQKLECEPTPENQRAFFLLVRQINNSDQQAEALALYARYLVKRSVLQALNYVQYALRQSPQNKVVQESIDFIFRFLGRSEEIKEKADALLPPAPPDHISITYDFKEEIVPAAALEAVEPSSEKVLENVKYELFNSFLKEADLPLSNLQFSEEFSDSWMGLVHFFHFLCTSGNVGKINGNSLNTNAFTCAHKMWRCVKACMPPTVSKHRFQNRTNASLTICSCH